MALALVNAGYGVLGTECEEAASGNAGFDGKIRGDQRLRGEGFGEQIGGVAEGFAACLMRAPAALPSPSTRR